MEAKPRSRRPVAICIILLFLATALAGCTHAGETDGAAGPDATAGSEEPGTPLDGDAQFTNETFFARPDDGPSDPGTSSTGDGSSSPTEPRSEPEAAWQTGPRIAPPRPMLGVEVPDPDDSLRVRVGLDREGDTETFAWSIHFGDRVRTREGTGTPPLTLTHRYQGPGTYTITHTLFGSGATRETIRTTITVHRPPPPPPTTILLASDYSGPVPLEVTLFPYTEAHPRKEATDWFLDPGDGSSGYGGDGAPRGSQRHRYAEVGTYQVNYIQLLTDRTIQRNITINVTPPQDTVIWTAHPENRTAKVNTWDGKVLETYHPGGIDCNTCMTPRDVLVDDEYAYVLIGKNGTNPEGAIHRFNRTDAGQATGIRIGPDPHEIARTDDGALWIASTSDDTIHRIAPRAGTSVSHKTGHIGNAPKTVVPVGDDSVWILEHTLPGTVVRLDPEALTPPARHTLPGIPLDGAMNHLHGMFAILLDATGTIVLGAPTTAGFTLRHIIDPGLGTDPQPIAITCASAGDHCFALYGNDTQGRANLITIHAATGTITKRIPFDNDTTAHDLAISRNTLFVATRDNNETTSHLVSFVAGTTTRQHTYTFGEPSIDLSRIKLKAVSYDPHPSIIYVTDPATGGWAIIDLKATKLVARHQPHSQDAATAIALAITDT